MKSICLIASTLLIVLISQHSTNGLPVDLLTTEHPCSEGFESVDGKCQPFVTEKVTLQKDEPKKFGACPEGKVHGKHGICEDIKSEDLLATTFEPKEDKDTPEEHESKSSDHTDEHEDVTKSSHHTDEHESKSLHQADELEDVTKSSHHTDEHESKSLHHTDEHEDVTKSFEDTTDLTDTKEKSSDANIPKGCPSGTKFDEQGACQDEVESSSKKPTLDLKDLLSTNGTCPDGMEMLKDKCVYVKPKQSSELDQVSAFSDDELKNIKNDEVKELVPLLPNNVCPDGTEYYSNGVCRKSTRPSAAAAFHSNVEQCGVDEILIDGKCTRQEIDLPSTLENTVEKSKSDKSSHKKKRHFH